MVSDYSRPIESVVGSVWINGVDLIQSGKSIPLTNANLDVNDTHMIQYNLYSQGHVRTDRGEKWTNRGTAQAIQVIPLMLNFF